MFVVNILTLIWVRGVSFPLSPSLGFPLITKLGPVTKLEKRIKIT